MKFAPHSIRSPRRTAIAGLAIVALFAATNVSHAQWYPPRSTPFQPVLAFGGAQTYHVNGQVYIRYWLPVVNRQAIPNWLFEYTGARENPSRTWVNIYDDRGKKLYSFTALRGSADLSHLWFAKKFGEQPPTAVYIELHDRLTGRTYRSNSVLLRVYR